MIMLFSVIISYWRRPREVKLSLDAFNKQCKLQNLDKLEVIICDSHSDDQLELILADKDKEFPNLDIKHLHTRNILAAKRNLGLNSASGEYLIFLDDDCIPADDFLLTCHNYIPLLQEKDKVICGEVRFLESEVAKSNYYLYRDSQHPNMKNKDEYSIDGWAFVAMNFLVKKTLLIKHFMYFNENFVGYGGEDHEYGLKLQEKNIEIIQGKQKIWHYEFGGTIAGYLKKIYHSSKDGMNILSKLENGRYVREHKKLNLIETLFTQENLAGRVLLESVTRLIPSTRIQGYLEKTDNNKKLYSRKLFRLAIIEAYIQGIKNRKYSQESDLKNNWYK